jgi:hypothetical protein
MVICGERQPQWDQIVDRVNVATRLGPNRHWVGAMEDIRTWIEAQSRMPSCPGEGGFSIFEKVSNRKCTVEFRQEISKLLWDYSFS